ncbi:SAM-dependent methyltransferase [Pseudohongiella sp.]|uniref:Methyltransferase type 11 domain-containing protein n=1 Tax=marine sediment metagenome TaxID=412755 RepID=A0A0F9W8X4_9ZZZZ|nr:methyltransferase domain-containing protein [Pseudohongiella sp.]
MKTTPQSLIFPLNIYAELLELAFGHVDFLSYGTQAEPDLSVTGAQQAMAARLLAMLEPAPGATVLDIGCGTGALAYELDRAGYQVTAIDVSEQAISAARRRFCEHDTASAALPRLVLADLQNYETDECFDVLVLQNSARYLSPLTVFAHARRLLKAGGQLLILEEFTGDDSVQAPEPLPVLSHVLHMAGRAGFELTQHHDVSSSVARWLEHCLPLFDQHLVALAQRTGLSTDQLLALRQSMADDLAKCQRGRYIHALLAFRMDACDVTLLPAELMPAERFQVLFERSFDTGFDASLWHWKYGDGRGHSVVACKRGEAVAHYGGISRDILYFGRPARALQICDVMVLPQHRSFYSKRSLFFITAATMLELHAGNTAEHLLGFGFPNIKAMHVAQRLGLYGKTDELLALSYPADGEPAAGAWTVAQAGPEVDSGGLTDALWQRMAPAFADDIIGIRDAAYLHYRYAQRPGLDYHVLVLTHPSGSHAIAVTRDHGEHRLIMDVVASADDLPQVLIALSQHGHDTGRPMVLWLSAGQLHRVRTASLHVEPTGIHIPCNAWTQGPAAETLQGKWWLTAGDMDFM